MIKLTENKINNKGKLANLNSITEINLKKKNIRKEEKNVKTLIKKEKKDEL
jgi:hypothetical protein